MPSSADDFKDPATAQPVMQPGAIDEAALQDPEEARGDAAVLDPVTLDLTSKPRP
jgi:hypothetical protein